MSNSDNIQAANTYLKSALEAVKVGDYALATVYNEMAMVCVQTQMTVKLGHLSDNLNRLASVTNAGKSWR